jgi:hypothetical protein
MPSTNANDRHILDKIWDLRRAGQIEQAKKQFDELMRQCGCSSFENFIKMKNQLARSSWSEHEIADLITFEASLLLRSGKAEEAHLILTEIEAYLESNRLPLTYQVLFQKALTSGVRNQQAEAAVYFALAAKNSNSTQQKLQAQLNVFICQEPIGLIDNIELEKFLDISESVAAEPWAADFIGQCDALKYRQLFLQGKLVFDTNHNVLRARGFQSRYFLAHLAGIPWIKFKDSSDYIKAVATELSASKNAYEGLYRMRTLLGIMDRSDFCQKVRISTHIERLYLWVWNWLTDPNPANLRHSLTVAKHVTESSIGSLGSMEKMMLENAISWLCLFRGESSALVSDLLGAAHQVKSAKISPQLMAEKQLISALFECRGSESGFDEHLLPKQIISNINYSELPEKLISSFKTLSKPKQSTPVQVDLLERRVQIHDNNNYFELSENYARLMHCFMGRNFVPLSEILLTVFGVSRYSPSIHDPKIAKLLFSANDTSGNFIKFRRKGKSISVEMNRADIKFVRCNDHILSAMMTIDDFELGKHTHKITSVERTKRSHKTAPISDNIYMRRDLEARLGLSKSTLNRRLKSWIKSKKVRILGRGPNVQYEILDQTILETKT